MRCCTPRSGKSFCWTRTTFPSAIQLICSNSAEFKARGAVFWPDYQRLAPDRSIWSICEVAYRDEPEIESGQVLIDKPAVFAELALTMWMNEHSDYFYAHIHGDKGTFQMAWRKLDRPYAMPAYGIESLDSTMCQHDFVGRRLFQHRNMDKWRLDGSNPRIRGFLYEDQCRAALADLRQRWTGIVAPPPRATGVSTLLGGETFRYRRVGLDDRPLQFLDGGRIGEGAASCERSWRLGIDGAGEKVLTVAGDASSHVSSPLGRKAADLAGALARARAHDGRTYSDSVNELEAPAIRLICWNSGMGEVPIRPVASNGGQRRWRDLARKSLSKAKLIN